jgi:hypothetical protein
VDKPPGEYFHTNWTGHGGNVTRRCGVRRSAIPTM